LLLLSWYKDFVDNARSPQSCHEISKEDAVGVEVALVEFEGASWVEWAGKGEAVLQYSVFAPIPCRRA
jgi:hypothetical protein